jgi:hypothetical protein
LLVADQENLIRKIYLMKLYTFGQRPTLAQIIHTNQATNICTSSG